MWHPGAAVYCLVRYVRDMNYSEERPPKLKYKTWSVTLMNLQEIKNRSPRWVVDAANKSTRTYALATVRWRAEPDFLVVGTKRGGTTSLFNYLLMHPGVLGLFPQSRGKKSSDYFFKDLGRGDQWYRSHFHTRMYRSWLARRLGYEPVGGEASPYYLWDPRVAASVRELAPNLRAIALLRDPVERAWSHYLERRSNGVEPLSFVDALAAEDDRLSGEIERMALDPMYYSEAHDWYSYRSRGVYLPQLQNWLTSFPEESLLVLRSEDMYADVQGTCDRISAFLGLPPALLPTTRVFGAGRQKGNSMPDSARRELTEFYAPHNRELEAFLGRPLGWS